MSSYDESLDLTVHTINRRASNHRNLVIVTCCALASAGAASVAVQSLLPVAALALLIPVGGMFFLHDARTLQLWRAGILDKWSSGSLELSLLSSTLSQLPHLPQDTITGMLSTLPDCHTTDSESELSAPSRQAVSRLLLSISFLRGRLILLRSSLSTACAIFLIASVYLDSWIPLPGCLLLFAYPALRKRCIQNRAAHISKALSDEFNSERIDLERMHECLSRSNLTPYLQVKLAPLKLLD